MPRRTATMLASLLTLIALICAGVLIPVPYSEMSPGPTYNTLGEHGGEPVLQISGRKTYPTSGHLNMTTVRVTGSQYRMNLVEAIAGWLGHDNLVVPHSTLYPDDKTPDQLNQETAEEFSQSQESAKVAALKQLDIPVGTRVVVASVVKGSPAEGKLHAGDVIKSVDGTEIKQPGDVAKLVTGHKPGEKVSFVIVPAKEAAAAEKEKREPKGEQTVTLTTGEATDDKRAIVGIQAGTDHTFPFTIDIKLTDVGGPSAGLMFALGIVDKLTPDDLTGGKFVAGTGTIDENGKVGPIGGIEMKTVGARSKGARYFLTPKANCAAAAKDVPSGLTLVKVDTIGDAMKSLEKIRKGDAAGLPQCARG
ncbi:YlbL family protein [Streptomyces albireticuli]|uniref:endopeptidase La n=1 Tax=Streptomyces albireticuli TaxID=1940 RepID=A0A2A2D1T5_9ACTN|nr:PDZ domain-containing protein [Streptomyces albireticuli]MCD9142507.1 PDZ domain-containing protein [Streptomyces albireticuli]MCD9163907.1 PDZ domain-containing protein [Streptomyces albireticuli]MCD9192635.1 PDZ domain-containing protein [Streptomyces albireticuli]PAU45369.1 PDZ/DHR/GLGF domain-containing protein [Streptomyces albireticuli]